MFNLIPLPYRILAGFALSVALIVGIFSYGYMKGSANAVAEINAFQAETNKVVVDLEKENQEISNTVVTEYVDRVQIVREKEYVYRDVAKTVVPNQYDMSNGWVYIHDAAASSSDADPARASDASSSGITDTEALGGIITNYSICQQNAEQLIQLQQWIADNVTAVEAENIGNK